MVSFEHTSWPRITSRRWRTRFAPSPTGYLHIGHLVNAIHVWGIAGAYGGDVLLRIEDHDRIRFRPEYESAILEDLEWLGLEADIFPIRSFAQVAQSASSSERLLHPARQSDQATRYQTALSLLSSRGLVYACHCSRREIAMASANAVHTENGGEHPYPGTCRESDIPINDSNALRVKLEPREVHFDDLLLGRQEQEPWRQSGDVLIRDRHRQWTYQFAVVVDDLAHEIDVVIRGQDLLSSTGRQLQIAELLGRTSERETLFLHHALIKHSDGSKLSKSRGDTAIRELRAAGFSPSELLGEAAFRVGLLQKPLSIEASDLANLFS